jgi:hypothetical protein
MGLRACILVHLLLSGGIAHATDVVVVASYLNVRNENGSILCVVPNGTEAEAVARDTEKKQIQLHFSKVPKNCPPQAQNAFVSSEFLAAAGKDAAEYAKVNAEDVPLYSSPSKKQKNVSCKLSQNTKVQVVDNKFAMSDETPWLQVRLSQKQAGCPKVGFVRKESLDPVNPFAGLPLANNSDPGKEDCCTKAPAKMPREMSEMNSLSGAIGRKIADGTKTQKPKASSQNLRIERKIDALEKAAEQAAAKFRNYAPHVCQRMGRRYPCGGTSNPHVSKGWCLEGVAEAVQQALGFSISGGTSGSATGSKQYLDSHFTRLEGVHSCNDAPRGAICLYDRRPVHNWGHIEIKATEHEYCSDFCAAHPLPVGKFMGAYFPPMGGN